MGHLDVVKTLLNRGAALRSKHSSGPSHEDSPLCLAAKNGHVSVVQELLTRGASVLQKDEQNWQPLRYAAFYAHPEVVELLLRHGATVSSCASGAGASISLHTELALQMKSPIKSKEKAKFYAYSLPRKLVSSRSKNPSHLPLRLRPEL